MNGIPTAMKLSGAAAACWVRNPVVHSMKPTSSITCCDRVVVSFLNYDCNITDTEFDYKNIIFIFFQLFTSLLHVQIIYLL